MTGSQPIVKVRYGTRHFYLSYFPKSMEDLQTQFKAKLAHVRDSSQISQFKFRFQDLWNDMVELQSDEDLKAMATQTGDKQVILLEISPLVEEKRPSRLSFDLKGFVSYCHKLSPSLPNEFNFIMEEGDQIPCESCMAKGVVHSSRGRVTCVNCSGSGARPMTPFWSMLFQVMDYKLNQRLFDHLETYLAAWPSQQPVNLGQTTVGGGGGLIQMPSSTSAVSELVKPVINVPPSRVRPAESVTRPSAFDKADFLVNDRLPSSLEVSDNESLIKQSPTMAKNFSIMGGIEEGRQALGNSSLQSSNIWPAASSKIEIAQSPKPIYQKPEEKMSVSKKLLSFATKQFDRISKGDRMSDEEQVTTKQIKFEWMGSKTVTVSREKPTLELKFKNTNSFTWGPWLSFILKSPKVKKAIQFDRSVPPGSSIHTTINGLEGIEPGNLIVQVKGLDESSLTKYYSERLELSVVLQ